MSAMNKDQKIALVKCKHHDGREWMAYITPRQMEYLVSLGAMLDEHWKRLLDYRIKEGGNRCIWFYFQPDKQLKEKLVNINGPRHKI